jgi:hypothetical protein
MAERIIYAVLFCPEEMHMASPGCTACTATGGCATGTVAVRVTPIESGLLRIL